MCLKFHALEVGSGDAFLLENLEKNEWRCLFDAGGAKKRIVDLLKEKGINKLNLAICSHNDKDHANGFLGLLDKKSGIDIDEIWLPGTWAPIIDFVKKYGIPACEIELYYDQYKESIRKRDITPFNFYNNYDSKKIPKNLIEEYISCINKEFCTELNRENNRKNNLLSYERLWKYYCNRTCNLFSSVIPASNYNVNQLLISNNRIKEPHVNLNNILEIARLAYLKKCKIKWYEPATISTYNKPSNGFLALNSKEIVEIREITDSKDFVFFLALTMENIYSLVFEYYYDNIPIVRFSADSDCTCQSVDPYNNIIIVTAPHHGSEANANVYIMIKGKDIIWVRSDRIRSKRPCQEFKNMNDKYCLACLKHGFKKEICFEYYGKNWHNINGQTCLC